MRYLVLILLLMGNLSDVRATAMISKQSDSNCVSIVKRLLQESTLGVSTGYGEKQSNRLGDEIGVALSKLYNDRNIVKAKNIKVFLPVIRGAFLHPDLISDPEDRIPTFTLSFLRNLESKVKDAGAKEKISDTIGWLLEHAEIKNEK
jgi:hypothetical protein